MFLYTTTSVPTILLSFRKRTIKYINKGTTMLNVSILGSIECNKARKNGILMLFCIDPLIFWLLNVKFWHHIHFFSDIFSHYNAPMSTSIVWYCEKFSGHSDFSPLLEFFFYFCYFWRKKKTVSIVIILNKLNKVHLNVAFKNYISWNIFLFGFQIRLFLYWVNMMMLTLLIFFLIKRLYSVHKGYQFSLYYYVWSQFLTVDPWTTQVIHKNFFQ